MISTEWLLSLEKESIAGPARTLQTEDIEKLVELLSEKNDKIRYPAFLLLQERSYGEPDVYPYWDTFRDKLRSDNSYQRSIGLMLLAVNTRWDDSGRMEATIEDYLKLLEDEKPITIRQCIQSLSYILPYQPRLTATIAKRLMALELTEIKDTMRKLVYMDILNILALIRESSKDEEIENYILNALKGDLLDKKSKKQIEELCKLKLF